MTVALWHVEVRWHNKSGISFTAHTISYQSSPMSTLVCNKPMRARRNLLRIPPPSQDVIPDRRISVSALLALALPPFNSGPLKQTILPIFCCNIVICALSDFALYCMQRRSLSDNEMICVPKDVIPHRLQRQVPIWILSSFCRDGLTNVLEEIMPHWS